MPFRLGRYDVLLPIASGGMATVYLGRMRGAGGFERDVAVKLAHPHLCEPPELVRELVEEGKVTARLRHPHAVAVLDVGEDDGRVYLVLEYIEGDTLSALIRRAPPPGLPVSIGLKVLLDALSGLSAAHKLCDARGRPLRLVHRDVSPQNILVGLDGTARISDFGIAKAEGRSSYTATGMVKGKTAYMPPEQARGRIVDQRADVWAAGVIAWEILAGRRLFEDDNDVVILLKLVSERPPLLTSLGISVPEPVSAVVARAIEPDLERRYPDIETFADDLARACSKAAVPIAEPHEVAAWVESSAGPRLRERRARAEQIVRARDDAAPPSRGSQQAPMRTAQPVISAQLAHGSQTVIDTQSAIDTQPVVGAKPPNRAQPAQGAQPVSVAQTVALPPAVTRARTATKEAAPLTAVLASSPPRSEPAPLERPPSDEPAQPVTHTQLAAATVGPEPQDHRSGKRLAMLLAAAATLAILAAATIRAFSSQGAAATSSQSSAAPVPATAPSGEVSASSGVGSSAPLAASSGGPSSAPLAASSGGPSSAPGTAASDGPAATSSGAPVTEVAKDDPAAPAARDPSENKPSKKGGSQRAPSSAPVLAPNPYASSARK